MIKEDLLKAVDKESILFLITKLFNKKVLSEEEKELLNILENSLKQINETEKKVGELIKRAVSDDLSKKDCFDKVYKSLKLHDLPIPYIFDDISTYNDNPLVFDLKNNIIMPTSIRNINDKKKKNVDKSIEILNDHLEDVYKTCNFVDKTKNIFFIDSDKKEEIVNKRKKELINLLLDSDLNTSYSFGKPTIKQRYEALKGNNTQKLERILRDYLTIDELDSTSENLRITLKKFRM